MTSKTTHGFNSTFFGELVDLRTKSGKFWLRSTCEVNARLLRGECELTTFCSLLINRSISNDFSNDFSNDMRKGEA